MKLEEMRKLCDEATRGPWTWRNDEIGCYEPYTDGSSGPGSWKAIIVTDSGVYPPRENDAAFIIAARHALPKLLAVAEAAMAIDAAWPKQYQPAPLGAAMFEALAALEAP